MYLLFFFSQLKPLSLLKNFSFYSALYLIYLPKSVSLRVVGIRLVSNFIIPIISFYSAKRNRQKIPCYCLLPLMAKEHILIKRMQTKMADANRTNMPLDVLHKAGILTNTLFIKGGEKNGEKKEKE
jgi:hypothetical protein